jgi:hypothetical protein
VSVDQRDNDPAVLLTYLAIALDRLEPINSQARIKALGADQAQQPHIVAVWVPPIPLTAATGSALLASPLSPGGKE